MQNSLKEKFLLFRIRAKKDPEAFGAIYDAYVKQIHRFIFFKVSSTEVAEDLTSETFLKAWNYLKEKRDVTNLQALIYSVARTVVIDHYRSTAAERATVSLDEHIENTTADPASEKLQQNVDTAMDTKLVLEKLRGLKDEYRDVVIMRFLDELSIGEIAEVLGKSASNVRVLLHRATKALSEAMTNDRPRTEKSPRADQE